MKSSSLPLIAVLLIIFSFEIIQGFRIFDPLRADPLQAANIYFYYGDKNREAISVRLIDFEIILKHPNFDISKKTTLYVHGFTETQHKTSTPYVREAYSYRKDHNFLTIDYNAFANGSYPKSVRNVPYVAPFVSKVLIKVFDAGLPIEKFHLVSHSLGSHLAGHIGRNLILQSGGKKKLKRITALDPAFPLFYFLSIVSPIRSSDAEFVDVIHTDAFVYGAPVSTGTVDFWPNGGTAIQPGCPVPRSFGVMDANDYCSHHRSWHFWIETVSSDNYKFFALKAKSYRDFKNKRIENLKYEEIITMGLNTKLTAKGNYYLDTSAESPFTVMK